MADPVLPDRIKPAPLSANAFKIAEYARTTYVATIPGGAKVEDLLEPSFWTNMASSQAVQIKPTDHIECVWEDFSQYAELIVIRPTKVALTCSLLHHVDLRAGSGDVDLGAELSNYIIRFAGAGIGYRVISKIDNTVLKGDGLPTELSARQWLIAHLSDGGRAAARTEASAEPKSGKKAA